MIQSRYLFHAQPGQGWEVKAIVYVHERTATIQDLDYIIGREQFIQWPKPKKNRKAGKARRGTIVWILKRRETILVQVQTRKRNIHVQFLTKMGSTPVAAWVSKGAISGPYHIKEGVVEENSNSSRSLRAINPPNSLCRKYGKLVACSFSVYCLHYWCEDINKYSRFSPLVSVFYKGIILVPGQGAVQAN